MSSGEGEEGVHEPHEERVRNPAAGGCGEADTNAHQQGDGDAEKGDGQ